LRGVGKTPRVTVRACSIERRSVVVGELCVIEARPATTPHRQPTPLACILYVGSELPEGAADTGRRTVRGRHFVSFMLH